MKNFLWGLAVVAGLILLPVLFTVYATFTTAVTAPGRVINKTLSTNNIIGTYEWFHDYNAQFKTRVSQIKSHKDLISNTTDNAEKSRLTMEVSAQKFSCRDLANRYNQESLKINKSIFKNGVPENLDATACE